jgi:leader peptidase (prepilin peptidase)/N-methyltransferase
VAVSAIDLEKRIIPDKITIPGIIVGLLFSLLGDYLSITQSLIGALIGGGGLFIIGWLGERVFRKEAMGGGDIKLAAMLGAFLGPVNIVLTIFLSAILGSIIALAAMVIFKKSRNDRQISFGPFLSAAGIIVMFYGKELIYWYKNAILQ